MNQVNQTLMAVDLRSRPLILIMATSMCSSRGKSPKVLIVLSLRSKTHNTFHSSLKNGYVDDLEFAMINKDDNVVQIRSASRLGYLDFGVNAKRINYFAKALREKGWDAPGVLLETHKGYAEENGVKSF